MAGDDAAINGEPPRDDDWAREISDCAADGVASDVPSILLGLLETYPGDDAQAAREAAREAARRIDADYQDVFLPSDPLLRGQDDKGMAGYLYRLYDLVLSVARLLDCDDVRQDALVQLLGELRELPPRAFRIWGKDCLVYTRDPVFAVTSEDSWNGCFVSSGPPLDESKKAAFEKRCAGWANFSSFVARCTAQGFYDSYEDWSKYPGVDIPLGLGLDGELPPGRLGSCRLMVAAQWILHCGAKVRADMAQADQPRWNLDRWNGWVARLREIGEGGIEDVKVRAAVEKALAAMVDDAGVS